MADPNSSPNPSPIDLSAGLVPAPANVNAGNASSIDLSAGLMPASSAQQPSDEDVFRRDTAYKQQVYSQAHADFKSGNYRKAAGDLLNLFHNPDEQNPADIPIGMVKGGGQSINTVSKGISKVAPSIVRPSDVQRLEQIETPSNTAQQVGAGIEGIGEFFIGDEALKGLSLAERLGLATRVAKLAESHPVVGKLISAGLNAVRSGTVGSVQGLAHGETAGQALKTGGVAAGTTGVLEGAGSVIKALAPKTETIAGTKIPVRASDSSKLADAAEAVSRSKPLQQFDVEQTQPAARQAIGNVATDVKNAVTTMGTGVSGADTTAFQDAVREIAPGKSFADLSAPEQSKVLAHAQELKTARNGLSVASKAADFGDAADQVRAQAKPVYEKLDELTKDAEMSFSDLQRAERSAFNKGDFDAVTKYQREQDKIFETFKNQFADPDAYQNARRMWRQASALDKIHDTITSKGVMESTPNDLIPKGSPDPRYIKGKQFSDTLLHLRDTGLLKEAGLTAQHIQDLQDIGRLLKKSGEVQSTNQLMNLLKVGTKVAVGGIGTAGAGWGASAVLGKIMTDADAAAKAVKALQAAQRVVPAMNANVYQEAVSALGGPSATNDETSACCP